MPALVLQPRFPVPDRSRQTVCLTKDEDGTVDIGWCEGVLSDGRAFRAEMWAQDQVSMLTVFFSRIGLESLDDAAMRAFAEREGLVSFRAGAPAYLSTVAFIDDGGSELWSVNIVVGDDEQTYLVGSVPIFPFSRVGEPNTMLSTIPIKSAHV